MSHLVIVEDDDRIATPLVRALGREGYTVERFARGLPAIDRVRSGGTDLVLLDLGLPDVDGLDVCKQLRDVGFAGGIMILTARDEELDRVVGLDSGADDYLAKPFALAELLARTRALIRRSTAGALAAGSARETAPAPQASLEDRPAARSSDARPTAGSALLIDRTARRVRVGGAEVLLTPKEFDLLALLDDERGAVLTRERVIAEVWDANWFGPTRMVDATLGRLRQKLEDADAPVLVTTVRGVGFRLDEDPPDA